MSHIGHKHRPRHRCMSAEIMQYLTWTKLLTEIHMFYSFISLSARMDRPVAMFACTIFSFFESDAI